MRFSMMMRISLLALGLTLLPVAVPIYGVPAAAADKDEDADKDKDGDKDKDTNNDKDADKKAEREAKKAEREAKKAEREAKKKAEREAKKAAREAKKAEREAKKAEREAKKKAEREARKAAKEAEKAAKEAEKAAAREAKEAERAAKEAEKAAEREAKEAEKAAEKAAKDGDKLSRRQIRENRKQAKELSKSGLEHLEKGEHEQAITAFSKAYELDPLSEHLFNLAVAHHLNRDKRKAYETYQMYLAADPDNRTMIEQATQYSAELKRDIDAEDAMLAKIKDTEDQVEKVRQEKERIRKENEEAMRKASEDLENKRQEVARAQEDLTRLQKEIENVGTGAGGGKRTIGTSMLAVGGVALGAAIFYGLDARSANNELDDLGPEDIFSESRAWLHERGETAQSRMILFSITGAALVAGGAVIYYLGEREAKRPPQIERGDLAVTPAVGPTSAGVQVSGSF